MTYGPISDSANARTDRRNSPCSSVNEKSTGPPRGMDASDYSQGQPRAALDGLLSQEGDRASESRVIHVEVRDEPHPAAPHRSGEDPPATERGQGGGGGPGARPAPPPRAHQPGAFLRPSASGPHAPPR